MSERAPRSAPPQRASVPAPLPTRQGRVRGKARGGGLAQRRGSRRAVRAARLAPRGTRHVVRAHRYRRATGACSSGAFDGPCRTRPDRKAKGLQRVETIDCDEPCDGNPIVQVRRAGADGVAACAQDKAYRTNALRGVEYESLVYAQLLCGCGARNTPAAVPARAPACSFFP